MPERTARDLRLDLRPRYEPRNLTFAAGLDHWVLGGSFTENALQSHWDDYEAAADHGRSPMAGRRCGGGRLPGGTVSRRAETA